MSLTTGGKGRGTGLNLVSDKAESSESPSSSLQSPQPSKATTRWGPTVLTFGPVRDISHPNHGPVQKRISVQCPPSRRRSFTHRGVINQSEREQTFLTPGSTGKARSHPGNVPLRDGHGFPIVCSHGCRPFPVLTGCTDRSSYEINESNAKQTTTIHLGCWGGKTTDQVLY